MKEYPKVHRRLHSILLEFAPPIQNASMKPLRMVLDFDELGEVSGIEIINLAVQTSLGSHRLAKKAAGSNTILKCSYDDESDSLYLRLKTTRSIDQKALQGSIIVDRDGQILAMRADW
jgi:uncharacterized protein YuzE